MDENYIHKVWPGMKLLIHFQILNGAAVGVCESIRNFIPHIMLGMWLFIRAGNKVYPGIWYPSPFL